MALRMQAAIDTMSTYGMTLFAIAIVMVVVFMLSNVPATTIPTSCYLYGSLSCLDLSYNINTIAGGSSLLVYLQMSFPGSINVSSFNAVVGGVKSTSGYCSTNGIVGGSTSVSQGSRIICIASFNSQLAPQVQTYSGTFNLSANYCAAAASGTRCVSGHNYLFAGSWRSQGSNSTFPINAIITTSVSTTTIPGQVGGAIPIYAYIQGKGSNPDYISVVNMQNWTSSNVFIASGVGDYGVASCVTVLPDQSQTFLVYTNMYGLYAYNAVTGNVVSVGVPYASSAPVASPTGAFVYAAYSRSLTTGYLTTVTTANDQVTNTVALTVAVGWAEEIYRTIMSHDGNQLYLALLDTSNENRGAIFTVNTVTHTVANSITEPGWPIDIALTPNGATLFALLSTQNVKAATQIQVFNTTTLLYWQPYRRQGCIRTAAGIRLGIPGWGLGVRPD